MPTRTYGPDTSSGEPKWTTGQGIGFLVALPGWLIAGLGLVGLMVVGESTWDRELMIVPGASAGFGVILAIPGTIVFKKCKRR